MTRFKNKAFFQDMGYQIIKDLWRTDKYLPMYLKEHHVTEKKTLIEHSSKIVSCHAMETRTVCDVKFRSRDRSAMCIIRHLCMCTT